MKTTIKQIILQNFKGCKGATYTFCGKNATVCGANGSGKTTIFDALTWLLFGRDSLDNAKFEVRPLDADGNKIDNVEIIVEAIFDIDGKEVELRKTQKQNWVKKRGSENPTLQGNVNEYVIDGYPRSEKEYKEYINGIVSDDLFKMLTNPAYFPNMPWKEQRATIMRFASEVSDVDLAQEDIRFAELIPEIEKAPSTDDIKNKYQKSLNELKKKQVELPVRIDEVSKSKVDIDVAELELQRNSLKERIAENKAKQDDVSKQFEEYQKLSDGIMELKFAEGDLQRKANEELVSKKKYLREQIDEKNEYLLNISNGIQRNNREIAGYENDIESGTKERNRLAELWKSVNSEVFDESTTICPTCHRELPTEETDSLRSAFEKSKAERLAKIEKDGMECKQDIENAKAMIPKLQECNKDNISNKEKLEKEVADLEKQLSELPTNIDISDTEEYKAIQKKISEKEQAMSRMSSADDIRQQLKSELYDLQSQLTEVEKQIVLSENNAKIDERISELQEEQREAAQKIADQEKMLYLLDEFIKYKLDKISYSINNQFELVNFVLFRTQINGGIVETCECQYQGVPYSSLNSAAKIQCGLDIIRSLQKMYGDYVPVFIDNRESCTNIPAMDCQVISLFVSPMDKVLRIEIEN